MVNSINEKTAGNTAEDNKGGEEGNTVSLPELDGRLQAMAKECPSSTRTASFSSSIF
jgi:hypothetical protein